MAANRLAQSGSVAKMTLASVQGTLPIAVISMQKFVDVDRMPVQATAIAWKYDEYKH